MSVNSIRKTRDDLITKTSLPNNKTEDPAHSRVGMSSALIRYYEVFCRCIVFSGGYMYLLYNGLAVVVERANIASGVALLECKIRIIRRGIEFY
jgi:hypothetical protein